MNLNHYLVLGLLSVVLSFGQHVEASVVTDSELLTLQQWQPSIRRLETRQQLCDALPPIAAASPNIERLKEITRNSTTGSPSPAEIHALLHLMHTACRTGVLSLMPSKDPGCTETGVVRLDSQTTRPLIEQALLIWSTSPFDILIGCIRGTLVVKSAALGALNIFTSDLLLELHNTKLRELKIAEFRRTIGNQQDASGFNMLSKIGISLFMHRSTVEEDIMVSGFEVVDIGVFESRVNGSLIVYANRITELALTGTQIARELDIFSNFLTHGPVVLWLDSPETSISRGISLKHSHVGGGTYISNVRFAEKGGLTVSGSRFRTLVLRDVKLEQKEGRAIFSDLTVDDLFRVDELKASTGIEVLNSNIGTFQLTAAMVGSIAISGTRIDQLSVIGGQTDGSPSPSSTTVDLLTIASTRIGSLSGISADVSDLRLGQLSCQHCDIQRNFRWAGYVSNGFTLRGSRVGDAIDLSRMRLVPNASIDLSSVQARVFVVTPETFRPTNSTGKPESGNLIGLNLEAAKLEYVSAPTADAASLLSMSSDELISILSKPSRPLFNPQPFATMAQLLATSGYRDTANDLHVHRVWNTLSQSSRRTDQVKARVGYWVGYGYKPGGMLEFLMYLFAFGTFVAFVSFGIERKPQLARSDGRLWWQYCLTLAKMFAEAVAISFIRMFPSIAVPESLRRLAQEPSSRIAHQYFTVHTVASSAIIFLLLTPLTGLFG